MPDRQPLHTAIRVAADPLAVLQRIVDQALALLPQADGASLEVRRDADRLEYLAASGRLAPHVGLRLPVQGSLSGLALLSGRIQLCRDALADPRVDRAAVASTGVRSMLCVPLADQPGSVAVLKVASSRVEAFSAGDAERLRLLARFLNTTVAAATELATATAEVLAQIDQLEGAGAPPLDWQQATAEFVANVLTPGLAERAELRHRVEQLLQQEALDILVQPVVALGTGQVVACEALSRFHSPGGEPPDWWFAAAQQVGLGVELELLAVRHALALLPQLPEPLHLAVNVGPETILEPAFLELVASAELSRLTLELTEHEAMHTYAAALAALQPLRQQGLRLSVDDTGRGYSGLTHILQLQPDVIKLDREMVIGVHADPVRRALAMAIAAFAEAIGAQVIAEGLELPEEADCLQQLGIPLAQGFLYWQPMAISDLPAAVASPAAAPAPSQSPPG